jgi:hypothetical protein
MAQQTINIGTTANDGTGDTIRDGGDKINDNFTELYAADTALDVRVDALEAGSTAEVVQILVTDPNGLALTTGDGKAYFRVPSTLSGLDLTDVAASVSTVSSSGIPTIQLRRKRSGADVDMLSTKLTIDASELDSSAAAAAAVINASNDDILEADYIFIDVDVAGTGAKGLIVEMQFA